MSSYQHNNNNLSTQLFLVLLLQLLHHVRSQSTPPPPGYPYADFNPSIITIIVILIAALFLMALFSIYIRRQANQSGVSIRAALSMRRTAAATSRGLDSSVIETFPTFVYSSVKGLKIGKGALECAVCLNEYEDEETLRLLPKCDHVFHPECIDAWFESHVTCPVCRANLVPGDGNDSGESGLDGSTDDNNNNNNTNGVNEVVEDSVSISVVDEPVVNVQETGTETELGKTSRQPVKRLFDKFRSHSTGHSLIQPGENVDRFTLRLPADVRKQVVNRALLNRMGSTTRMVGEGSGKTGYRTGGAISGRRKPYRRLESLDRVVVRSERWVMSRAPSFLSRALSIRSPRIVSGNGAIRSPRLVSGNGEASTSSSSMPVDTIPLNNFGPKSC